MGLGEALAAVGAKVGAWLGILPHGRERGRAGSDHRLQRLERPVRHAPGGPVKRNRGNAAEKQHPHRASLCRARTERRMRRN